MPNKLTPFHHWVNKVLPEIYDDSLSYYELLNKVVSYLNQAMNNVNTLSDNVTAIYNTVVELQEYIDLHMEESIENAIEEYFRTHTMVGSVVVSQELTSGEKIGSITVDGVQTDLFAPEGGNVGIDQVLTSGVEIAGVTVGGVRTPIFAQSISATANVFTGTKIGSISIGGDIVELFAPEGGSNVSFSPTLTTGVEIGVLTIGENVIRMYAPSGGGGSGAVDSVNGRIGDVVLTAEDVGARSNTWIPTAEEVGARDNTWMPTAEEVGARPDNWMPTAAQVGALPDTVTALPNPNKLVFTGAVTAEYDGRSEISVNIPEGGGNVDSVNGKTGAVNLSANDVGAVPKPSQGDLPVWDNHIVPTYDKNNALRYVELEANYVKSHSQVANGILCTNEYGQVYVATDATWTGGSY